ncbi:MAG: hypothetical protein AVDCRST_MAG31-559 [uncultured Sphingomonas sp.]|uniref:Uncharacterized protein n=1 Tax=uncultured Sphingomonas sp. TaxID=158754 RepID=A0A6J4SUC0_9SPHN|nr:hypothetical protein [uncultured Sphingomonas sp.]CAA9505617.1 MAG: hypothetical protein AVDCRST_MAG31-559 [uncultured Sphingomonas sp.]
MPEWLAWRNLLGLRAFYNQMSSDLHNKAAAEVGSMDRRIIRVELPPAHAGVTAALRRAFASVPSGNDDRQFEELLARLG